MNWLNLSFIVMVLTSGIRLAAPVAYAAIGGLTSERSGMLNIALEGLLLAGAFCAFIGSWIFNSVILGTLCGIFGGMIVALLFAWVTITIRGDQLITGLAINTGVLGLATFIFRMVTKNNEAGQRLTVPSFDKIAVPVLSDIPVIGPIFFNHHPLIYLLYFTIPVMSYILFRTHYGLALNACGENPLAADTAGINVIRKRYQAMLICGALCGLGGATLTIGELSTFNEQVVNGRGFIALAAVIFGRWHPLGATLAALLFGVIDALQLRLQAVGVGISNQFLQMLPYLIAFITFITFIYKSDAPSASGKPYPEE